MSHVSERKIIPVRPIPTDIVETLRVEGSFPPGIRGYPDRLQRMFRTSKVANSLLQVAALVEPVDRVLGVDRAKRASRAFRSGALLGLRVVSECVDSVDAAFAGTALKLATAKDNEDDSLHARHVFASGIIDLGREAYAKVDEVFNPFFDEWENVLEPSVPHQTYLRGGFGIPIAYLYACYAANEEAVRQADLVTMAKAADRGIDWDTEFQNLLS